MGHPAGEVGGETGGGNQRERDSESRTSKDGGRETETTRRARDDLTEI